MNKKELFEGKIKFAVYRAMEQVYGVTLVTRTVNQMELAEKIAEETYKLFGNSVTIKELQES